MADKSDFSDFSGVIAEDLVAAGGSGGWRGALKALAVSPSFNAVFFHRVAARLGASRLKPVRWLAHLLWRVNTALTSCHLHLSASIRPGLFLPHPTGIVVGAGVRIGRNVTIYQNVTLGANLDGAYPNILDGTIIYPGAVLIGDISVGPRAVVGALSFVNRAFGPDAVVAGAPAKKIKSGSSTATAIPN